MAKIDFDKFWSATLHPLQPVIDLRSTFDENLLVIFVGWFRPEYRFESFAGGQQFYNYFFWKRATRSVGGEMLELDTSIHCSFSRHAPSEVDQLVIQSINETIDNLEAQSSQRTSHKQSIR